MKIIIGLIVCIVTFAVIAAGVREEWGAAALIFIIGAVVTAAACLSAR